MSKIKHDHQVAGYVDASTFAEIETDCISKGVSRSEWVSTACTERLTTGKPAGVFDARKCVHHLTEALKELLKATKKS